MLIKLFSCAAPIRILFQKQVYTELFHRNGQELMSLFRVGSIVFGSPVISARCPAFAGSFQSPVRPDGVWVKPNETVSPVCLFEAQLELRKKVGRLYH